MAVVKQATRFRIQPGWKILLQDIGLQSVEVLRCAGLPADLFSRADLTLSADEYFNFWHGMEAAAGAALLPLKIVQKLSVDVFDPPLFASFCSPDLQTALNRLATYKRLVGPLHLKIEPFSTHTQITLNCYGYTAPLPKSVGLAELLFFTWLARTGTRQHIVPRKITVNALPERYALVEEFFGNRLLLTDSHSISFSAEDMQRPFVTENESMWKFFQMGLTQRLSELNAESSMSERVGSVLLEMLPSGNSRMEQVASRLALSPRTLQRQLQAESSSFQKVLNQTRIKLAKHYLLETHMPLDEIAFLLSFQDGNSFIRAFRNVVDITPAAYRQMERMKKEHLI